MEKVHSYGYDTNGSNGCVMAAVHGAPRPTLAGSTMVDSMSSPDCRAAWIDFFFQTFSRSAAPSAVKARTTWFSPMKTLLRGSRKEPGSW